MSDDFRDNYTYPGTNVLVNKAGLRDQAELSRFERGATSVRIAELRERPIQGDYDLAHMRAIHGQVFKDVYEWAGQVRTVEIVKGAPGDRTLFAFTEDIPRAAEMIHREIREVDYLRGMNKEQFTTKLSGLYADLNTMHPFREGNGRATREFMSQLGTEAGYTLDFSKVERQQWNEAAKESFKGNLQPMKEVLDDVATPTRAIAFRDLPQNEALARHPELDAAYKGLVEARQRLTPEMAQHEREVSYFNARAEIIKALHDGKIPQANVTLEESKKVIDHAAAYRGLIVREADRLGGDYRGQVVAVSSHHALLKVGDSIAVRYERDNLDRVVQVGDRVAITYDRDGSRVEDLRRPDARAQEAQPKALETKTPETGVLIVDGMRATQIEYERTHIKVPDQAQLERGRVVILEQKVSYDIRLKEGGQEVARFENLTQERAAQIVGEANAHKIAHLIGADVGHPVGKPGEFHHITHRGELSGERLSNRGVSLTRDTELARATTKSGMAVRNYVDREDLTLRQPDTQRGNYNGKIALVTDKHVLQRLAGTVAIEHERVRFDSDVRVGEKVAIQYAEGHAKVQDFGRAREGRDMQMEREIGGR